MLVFAASKNIFPQNGAKNFEFSWGVGTLGGGTDFLNEDACFELSVSIGDFSFRHTKTNIGLEFNVFKTSFYYYLDGNNSEKTFNKLFLLNPGVYWDVIRNRTITFGPFVSVDCLIVNDLLTFDAARINFSPAETRINAGLRFLWKSEWLGNYFSLYILGAEAGYRNMAGNHNVYFTIKIIFP
jgi:hypothetical protein